jgi:hypothetical protein
MGGIDISEDIEHIRLFVGTSYTGTIKYAVNLDDYLYNNRAQVMPEFRNFYKSFLSLYLATNNLLINSRHVLGKKMVDEGELSDLFNKIEHWISEVKTKLFKVQKKPEDLSKGQAANKIKQQPPECELMQDGIVLFNDYCNYLIKYNIIRIE